VRVLDMQPDHPVAIQNAVRQLFKMGYKDDANELIDNALQSGTTSIPIYLTAIDLAKVRGEPGTANNLREQIALLPTADDALILKTVDYFVEGGEILRAVDILERALTRHPDNQALLLRMADMQENLLGNKLEAHSYYNRAAQIKGGASSRQLSATAEKALKNFTPPSPTKSAAASGWRCARQSASA
jgi:tetratricopeptide (TPR) repeat protein